MARHSAIPAAPRQVDSVVLTVDRAAAYMAPEEVPGRPADKRSDFMGVRCVLYEMLTGTPAVSGEDLPETLTAVLTRAEKS